MKKQLLFIVSIVLLCVAACTKPYLCGTEANVKIQGPDIAYLDSSFTLSVTANDNYGYEWIQPTMQYTTGEPQITISPVHPEDAGQYVFVLHSSYCKNRTLTKDIEVRPIPFDNSPCTTPLNQVKLDGAGTYTITSKNDNPGSYTYYHVEAHAAGCDVSIELGRTEEPVYDQIWNVGISADYHTADVEITSSNCFWQLQPGTTGLLYVNKVTGGTEYSMCGVSFRNSAACGFSFDSPTSFKFVIPD